MFNPYYSTPDSLVLHSFQRVGLASGRFASRILWVLAGQAKISELFFSNKCTFKLVDLIASGKGKHFVGSVHVTIRDFVKAIVRVRYETNLI